MSSRSTKAARTKGVLAAKATIYVAAIGLIGAIVVAVISNSDKLFGTKEPTKEPEATAIGLFQEDKYAEVMHSFDSQTSMLERYRDGLSKPLLLVAEDARKGINQKRERDASAIILFLQGHKDARNVIEGKHRDLLAAAQAGNNLKVITIKTDVNRIISEDSQRYADLERDTGIRFGVRHPMYTLRPSPLPGRAP
jgi:hypothetical protein